MRDVDLYYNRAGEPIPREEAYALMADPDARRVALTMVGPYVVSTVHLIHDHNFGSGPPIIFETMVFTSEDWEDASPGLTDVDTSRYATEAEALAGHEATVLLVRATASDDLSGDRPSD